MRALPYADRAAAGRELAALLGRYGGRDDVVVLGLARGGVPVAREVARGLAAPLDVLVVRKLGLPGREELAMGAIAAGGTLVLNRDVLERARVGRDELEAVEARERAELDRRERAYRGERPALDVRGRISIAVDDGLATGATMRAAVAALRRRGAASVTVAVPVAAQPVCDDLARRADEVVCAHTPDPFVAVGVWYLDFRPVSDERVRALLAEGRPPADPSDA